MKEKIDVSNLNNLMYTINNLDAVIEKLSCGSSLYVETGGGIAQIRFSSKTKEKLLKCFEDEKHDVWMQVKDFVNATPEV